ncbi:MAG: choice-of-anchor J domain-containing protein [Rhodothermales bacterium]
MRINTRRTLCIQTIFCSLFLSGLVLLTLPAAATQADTLWSENWEGDFTDNWFVDNGSWEVGEPTSGPGSAYEGGNVGATVLDGDYSDSAPDSRLIRFTSFVVPSAEMNPALRFWHYVSFGGGDFGRVDISTDGGNIWESLSPNYFPHSTERWTNPRLDLSAYAGQEVQLALFFHSENLGGGSADPSSGWYVDDIAVITGPPLEFDNPQNWEAGIGDWVVAELGTWEVGEPTSGPGGAFAGTQAAATILDGNYADSAPDSRLISPLFTVPALAENPRLRFWHWWSFGGGDYGRVEISNDGGTMWEALSPNYTSHSTSRWTRPLLDLSAYAGQEVQLALFFHSENLGGGSADPSSGWYVDDIAVITGSLPPVNIPEGWETGVGGWHADFGTWEVGIPTSGPGSANTGEQSAATILDGNYSDSALDSRLISPVFVLDGTATSRVCFWHWFSFGGGDFGETQIREIGGEWTTIGGPFTSNSSGVWTFFCTSSLPAYAGQEVQLAFFFHSENLGGGSADPGVGWYIDDIGGLVTVASEEQATSGSWNLRGVYPNPFARETIFAFFLPGSAEVMLRVFDVLGREVGTVTPGLLPAGEHRIPWRAAGLASGVYLYRVEARMPGGTEVRSGRLTVMQ